MSLEILVPESRRTALTAAITRKQALAAGFSGLAAVCLAACGGQSGAGGRSPPARSLAGKPVESELLMSNWVSYVDPKDLESFHRSIGPKVTLDSYSSNDELIAKLSAGGSNYDVIVPSGIYVPECIEKGLLMPLDHSLIPNLKNLEPSFRKMNFDPEIRYAFTKNYGITSFYYRKDVVKDPPTTLRGWMDVLPEYAGRNINFMEGGSEIWGIFLLAAGHHKNTEEESAYEDALRLALKVKPAIKTISSTYIDRLGRGQIDIGLGWNGDVLQGANEARKHGVEIGFTVPEGPGEYWTDTWAIAAGSKNPVAAHRWLDYVLRPEIAGREWDYFTYKVPVVGAEKHVSPEIADSPMIDIPADRLAGYENAIVTPRISALTAEYYTKFKA